MRSHISSPPLHLTSSFQPPSPPFSTPRSHYLSWACWGEAASAKSPPMPPGLHPRCQTAACRGLTSRAAPRPVMTTTNRSHATKKQKKQAESRPLTMPQWTFFLLDKISTSHLHHNP